MTAARPWTPAEDTRLRDLAAQGTSTRAMAREFGCGAATVRRRMQALGITVDRTRTAAATKAAVIDAKARRAALELRLLARADHLLDRLEAPEFVTVFRGEGGAERRVVLDFVPPRDEKDLTSTATTALNASLKISAHDADTGLELAAVDQWLTHITGGA